MTILTLRNARLLLLIILLSILLIVSMLFYMKYNDENITNQRLLTVPRYDWREYIEYLKTAIEVPLKDEVQLFGFSDKVNLILPSFTNCDIQ